MNDPRTRYLQFPPGTRVTVTDAGSPRDGVGTVKTSSPGQWLHGGTVTILWEDRQTTTHHASLVQKAR